jgi:hypothetical protein
MPHSFHRSEIAVDFSEAKKLKSQQSTKKVSKLQVGVFLG